jgi:SAM-dependent methyltransferase
MCMSLVELGQQLRAAGLTPRALAAWAGTDRIPALSAVPAASSSGAWSARAATSDDERTLLDELAAREPTPAAVALSLFVAGRDIAIDKARGLPIDQLLAHELVVEDNYRDAHEDRGRCLRATVAILPVGKSLIVCDRHDAAPTSETVCWPDDSSYHLASAIPHVRFERWLDLGCGSGFAPLARPEAASAVVGVELNRLACEMARTSIELSGIGHVVVEHGDLAIEQAAADLVTCNAPMPGGGVEMWRFTGRDSGIEDFFARLWRVVPERVTPGGIAIVHAALTAIPHERLPGERRIVVYTPPEVAPAFGVLAWRPDGPDRVAVAHRALTAQRPHVDADDLR